MTKQLIYDVGAHRGEDADFYLRKGFDVVCVEANSKLAAHLRERFAAQIGTGQLKLVEAAIADREGEVEFYVNDHLSVWGTLYDDWAERNRKMGATSVKVKVAARRFESLLAEYGVPHYLKVDIEGADMVCIRALASTVARPRFVSIESSTASWEKLLEEFETLTALGYTRFKLVNQAQVHRQVEPSPAREGAYVGEAFAEGSSGLFGSDLPGKWLTKREALKRYALIFVLYRFFGNNTLGERVALKLPAPVRRFLVRWYDTHAALPEAARSGSRANDRHDAG